jgi:winged helix DNA-binding protein
VATIPARQLNRATLQRQLLLRRQKLGVVEAVRRVVALQAQSAPSPYLALWNRVDGFDPDELTAAFADHGIVKASLMRITLHAVTAEDYPVFHAAMTPVLRAARLHDKRFTSSGLTGEQVDAALADVLAFARTPRNNADMEAMLTDRLGTAGTWAWWALRTYAPVRHAPTGQPWSFGQRPAYRAEPSPVPRRDRVEALGLLIRRYLDGFGPATVPDMNQFTMTPRAAIREALATMDDLVRTGDLYDLPGRTLPPADTPAPARLMAMWDSALLAYADRGRIIPDAYRRLVIRGNGDILPTLLVDGYVAGVWRPAADGIEATAFHPLAPRDWRELTREAARLRAFLREREPTVYQRYGRWWNDLPAAEVRVLG